MVFSATIFAIALPLSRPSDQSPISRHHKKVEGEREGGKKDTYQFPEPTIVTLCFCAIATPKVR